MLGNVNYEEIGDKGLYISFGAERRDPQWLDVDTIVLCAGQVSENHLAAELDSRNVANRIIGGAFQAGELDAKQAIDQGCRMAAAL